jgi:hypothetical protein
MQSEQTRERKSDYTLTPHGGAHRSTVALPGHPVDPKEVAKHRAKSIREIRALNPHGWIESATFCPSVPLGFMRFNVTVPEPPEHDGALIYLFAGAQDMQLSTILQPVLQWGSNGCFGGDHWCVACWQADANGCHHVSEPMRVEPGADIEGTLQVKGYTDYGCDWEIVAKDLGTSEQTRLDVPGLSSLLLFLVGGALEAYSLDCCGEPSLTLIDIPPQSSQYPKGGVTEFRNIELRDLRGERIFAYWNDRQYEGSGPNRGFNVQAVSDAVTLSY